MDAILSHTGLTLTPISRVAIFFEGYWALIAIAILWTGYLFWPAIREWLPLAVPPPGPLHFRDLAVDEISARSSGRKTAAARAFNALPNSANLQQQAFDLTTAMKKCIVKYHNSLDIDSLLSPEISKAFSTRLRAVRDKVERFSGIRIGPLPMPTVRRIAKFLDDIEVAAGQLKGNVPPVV
jgi:hypothetical protein